MTLDEQIEALVTHTPGFWQLDACGVTRTEREIPALMHGTAQPPAGERIQLVLIGGLSGTQEDADAALAALNSYSAASGLSDRVALSAVPCGNPDGLALGSAPENGAGGNPSAAYPPPGDSYYDANPEAHYLWRWVSFQGPDLALEIRVGAATTWQASAPCQQLLSQFRSTLNVSELPSDSSLLGALADGEPNLLPPVPSLRLTCAAADLAGELAKLWTVLAQVPDHARSTTRRALQARVARSPLAVARILAGVYGHELDPVIYTQGVAVSGRLRLAQLDPDGTDPSADIEAIAAPYMSGAKPCSPPAATAAPTWPASSGPTNWPPRPGMIATPTCSCKQPIATAPATTTACPPVQPQLPGGRHVLHCRRAGARLQADRRRGLSEHSDPLPAGCRRAAGRRLFWHDRRTPFYWGRGNGFAALSYAEALTYLPDSHPDRAAVLAIHRRHLHALRGYQHRSGMWRQVINGPGSYPEMTVTCMVGYASPAACAAAGSTPTTEIRCCGPGRGWRRVSTTTAGWSMSAPAPASSRVAATTSTVPPFLALMSAAAPYHSGSSPKWNSSC